MNPQRVFTSPVLPGFEAATAATEDELLRRYGVTRAALADALRAWDRGRGTAKAVLEQRLFGTRHHHGKLITRLWRQVLQVETEQPHPLRVEVERLRAFIRRLGYDPHRLPDMQD
jgi:hypothetical protein